MRHVRATIILLLFLVLPASAGTFTVTNTNDSGPGSLRQAILDADASLPGTVIFSIGTGARTITPLSVLPDVTNILIDGTTQPGYGGTPLIELNNSLIPTNVFGYCMTVTGGTVRAIATNRCTGRAIGVSRGRITACFIGTDITGHTILPNSTGIFLNSEASYIGGANDAEGNLISGNTVALDISSAGSEIAHNRIGTNVTGDAVFSYTGNAAVSVAYTQDVTIHDNIIGGHQDGIECFYSNGTIIQNNRIGVGSSGGSISNLIGIHVYQSNFTKIIGNEIAYSTAGGIEMDGASIRNQVSGNSIHNNGQMGIDLSLSYTFDGVTPNDQGDADTGPNLLQNYPIITSAKVINGQTVISGTLNSQPGAGYTIELFASPDCGTSGYGEGKTFVGSTNVSTDGSGNATFTYTSGTIFQGQVITATATDSFANTSEFSACRAVDGAGTFVVASPAVSVNEGAGSVTITVNRTNGIVGDASVFYETVNETATAGSDYTAVSGVLAFVDGEASKTINVPILDDSAIEGTETFSLNLTLVTNGATIGIPRSTTVSIIDNEQPPVMSVSDVRMNEGNSGATNMAFTVTLSHSLTVPATVQYNTSSNTAITGSDYQFVSGTLTFNPGETQKTINVPILGDTSAEADETFYLDLFTPTNAILDRAFAIGTIVNDDAGPTVSDSDVRIVEGNSGTANAVIVLTASQPLYGEVDYFTVDGTAKSGSDYLSRSGSVFFNFETTKTISIPIVGDTLPEPDEAFTVHLSLVNYSNPQFILTNTNATVVIATDDGGIGPSVLSVARGTTGRLTASFGSTTTPQTVTLTSSDPTVATVPASVQITGTAEIEVTALQLGHTTITATVPPAFGSVATLIDVYVYEPANLVLTPLSITVPAGFPATISASFQPALGSTEGASLVTSGTGAITFPDRVLVDPSQTATFTIRGVTPGFVLLTATLGPNHGNATATVSIQVTAAPTTPTITQISPANGTTAGGTNVTLNGANLRADCAIRFGGAAATKVAFVSATSMTATTPGHSAGATDVSLACGTDTFTLSNAFTYLAASTTLSSVSPSFGTTAGSTVLRITGTNFTSGCWPFFDGIAARTAYATGPSEMIAATPAHPIAATVPLMLRCSGAPDVSLADAFTYSSAESSPVITTVDPLVGSAGKTVTISGARFRFDDVVTFDTTPAIVLSTSPGTHVVRIPDLPLGKTSISVTDLAGRTSTTGPIFTIVEPQPPQIMAVSPTTTRPGNEITLDGSGFRPGYSFTIGDLPATLVSMTYTRAVVRVPQLAAGNYPVNVLNAASKIAAVGPPVTVLAPGLVITRITPSCVTTEGGTRIAIYGTGFANGAVVTFDGVVAGATLADAQTISVILPPLPAGMPRIVVTNPNGDSATLSNGLNVVSPFDPNGCTPRGRPARR